jgi:hypothetical protein
VWRLTVGALCSTQVRYKKMSRVLNRAEAGLHMFIQVDLRYLCNTFKFVIVADGMFWT